MAEALNILHVDMDAFYAAVEVLDHPELMGKPVIVGGPPQSRGVVSSATYEARAFGVRSAMPCSQAYRLCPQAIFTGIHMERYAEVSRHLMRVLRSFTPAVEPLSLDEAFLDLSGTERIHGGAIAAGRAIKRRIREEMKLVASVGVSFNKFLAKLGSDLEKPDGFVVLRPEDVERRLDPLPVGRLWGVGVKTEPRLAALGLKTIGDVRRAERAWLENKLGELGRHIAALSRGEDERTVQTGWEAKSIGAERTFDRDISSVAAMERALLALSDEVAARMRADGVAGRTIQIKVRFPDFRTITRARTLESATDITREVFEVARALLRDKAEVGRKRVRLLGVQASHLGPPGARQGSLFEKRDDAKERRLDKAIDALRHKHGDDVVVRAETRAGEGAGERLKGERRPK